MQLKCLVLTNVLIYGKLYTTHEKSFKEKLPELHFWLKMNLFRKQKKS